MRADLLDECVQLDRTADHGEGKGHKQRGEACQSKRYEGHNEGSGEVLSYGSGKGSGDNARRGHATWPLYNMPMAGKSEYEETRPAHAGAYRPKTKK